MRIGYDHKVAAYFPFAQAPIQALDLQETAIVEVVKASKEELESRLASMLLDLVAIPQSRVTATFLLVNYVEELGPTAVGADPGILLSHMLCN